MARWLGDQFGPAGSGPVPGSAEDALFRELSSGGPAFLSGPSNIERAVQVVAGQSRSWDELLAEFLGMLAVDVAGAASWIEVMAANVLAAVSMGWYLWKAHPDLRKTLSRAPD